MKKSRIVNLVLITAALASCNKSDKQLKLKGNVDKEGVYMRSDTTAKYSRASHHSQHHAGGGGASPLFWYYVFRPYGSYYGNTYHHAGYYSSGIPEHSNIGVSPTKSSAVRGGFGGTHSYSVSS